MSMPFSKYIIERLMGDQIDVFHMQRIFVPFDNT